MKKIVLCLFAASVFVACKTDKKSEKNEQTADTEEQVQVEKSEDDEWIDLFNGENLDGWIKYGTEEWYVDEDGYLVCESGPDEEYGYLGTEEEFDNFELKVQFKQEADGNSGVFFHSSFEGTKVTGWQAEVAPPGDNTGGIYESYGRGWLITLDEDKEDV